MRLLQIQLDGFGQFNKGLSVRLDPARVNLVVGRNEAGKSTLMSAISGILFGFRDLNVMRRYEPWGDHESYAGELEFLADDGRRIRIARDFRAGTATIVSIGKDEHRTLFGGSADPRGTTADDRRYFDLLGELLGIQDESVFRNTVFVGQMSLETSVSDQIRRLLSGCGSIDYKGALHELHGRHAELTSENPWKSKGSGKKRILDQSRDDLAATDKHLEEGGDRLLRFVEAESELIELDRRKAEQAAQVRALATNLEAAEKLASLLSRRAECEKKVDEARQQHLTYAGHQEKAQAIEERVRRDFQHFRNAPESFQDDANVWIAEVAERDRDVGTLAGERSRLETLQPKSNRTLGIVLAGIVLAGSAVAGFWSPFGLAPAAIVGCVLGFAAYLLGCAVGTGFKAQKAEIERRIAGLEGAIKTREKRLDDLASATQNLLVGADAGAMLANYRVFTAMREDRRRHLAAMRALGDSDSLSAALADAVRDQGRVESATEELLAGTPWLSSLADLGRLGVEITRLKTEIASRERDRETERERSERLRLEIAGLTARMDFDLPRLAESAKEKRAQVRDLALEKDALREAIDTLDACIKEFQESDVFRLSDEMSQVFARITGDKYTRVHLGPSLEPLVATGDRVGIRPEELSAGAHDQLYFAMRIAMVRHLARNIRLPIFLDDPFVNFDSERLAVTRDVLNGLRDHQVILVSCDRNYQTWAQHVVDLDRMKAQEAAS
jgi:uncharacterized protein YhaN